MEALFLPVAERAAYRLKFIRRQAAPVFYTQAYDTNAVAK